MKIVTGCGWHLSEDITTQKVKESFGTLESVFACEGETVASDVLGEVLRFQVDDETYYIKRYKAAGKKLRRYLGRSRIHSEWNNLSKLKQLGVPVPKIVAYGELRINGQYQHGAMITRAVENSIDLQQAIQDNPELVHNKKWLQSVMQQVADYVRIMHEQRFIYQDLNWRNILVNTEGDPQVCFIDCPSGGFKFGFALQRGLIRDLAHLDKVARLYLKATDLLRFYMMYHRIEQLTKHDKKEIERIRHLHDKHRERKQKRLAAAQQRNLDGA